MKTYCDQGSSNAVPRKAQATPASRMFGNTRQPVDLGPEQQSVDPCRRIRTIRHSGPHPLLSPGWEMPVMRTIITDHTDW